VLASSNKFTCSAVISAGSNRPDSLMIGLDVFSSFLFCSSSSSLDADDGVENDVADESISGLDVGLISVDI
jgi:hypothetical protein